MISADSFLSSRGVRVAVFLVAKTSTLLPRSVLTQKNIFGHGCYMCFLSHGDLPSGVCACTDMLKSASSRPIKLEHYRRATARKDWLNCWINLDKCNRQWAPGSVLVVKYFGFPVHPQRAYLDQSCDFETEKSDCPEFPPPDPYSYIWEQDHVAWKVAFGERS